MKYISFIIAVASLLASSTVADARKLTVIHVNDTHSHIEAERTGERKGMGGVIEQAAYIDSVRAVDGKSNVLLLHAGDFSQGTSYFSMLHGDIEISMLNAMRFDAVCLGNHEFDNGIEELSRRLSSLKMPVVCSNYRFDGVSLGKIVKPYATVRKAGKKIGFAGMLTDLTFVVDRSVADSFKYLEPAEAVSHYARILKEKEHCDIVICLSHCGWNEDLKIAESLSDVDIIVGGHSHTRISTPAVVRSADGKDIIIVQDGEWGLEMGNLKIEL